MRRGDLVAEPTGKRVEWDGLDVIPFEDGLVKRKDVYSDSVSILRQVGLLDWRQSAYQATGSAAPVGSKAFLARIFGLPPP